MPLINRKWHDAWWRLISLPKPESWKDGLVLSALQATSWAYAAVVGLRNAAYDRGWIAPRRSSACVISIGNLTVGGTGKTAATALLARKLGQKGRQVAVLSRGYGAASRQYRLEHKDGQWVVDGAAPAQQNNLADEPRLLAQQLEGMPVFVGAARTATAARAVQEGYDTLLLDDGFQHRQLARDCDIVLVHARMPFGGSPLLPRGVMREPLSALKRAGVIVITKADENLQTLGALRERLHTLNRQAVIAAAVHAPVAVVDVRSGQREDPRSLAGQRVGLLSSIGDPEGFEATIRRLGASVAWHKQFPDHHAYDAGDLSSIDEMMRRQPCWRLLTTAKDWVRLKPWIAGKRSRGATGPLCVLEVAMQLISGETELDARLDSLFAG